MPKPRQRESESQIGSSPSIDGLDRRLGPERRMIASALFRDTFSQNRKFVGRYMVLWLRSGEGAALRLGVITSKKLHLRANKRNLARRRLREAYRTLRPWFSGDFDVLLIGRRAILKADWKDVLRELLQLAARAGILPEEQQLNARRKHDLD